MTYNEGPLNGALSGLKVLDLTRLLPGAFCTKILADLGAEVIKIEDPVQGDYMRTFPPLGQDGMGVAFSALNAGKLSMCLNLKDIEGRNILMQLVKNADVVVESYRPGVARRLGIAYDDIAKINPKIIYASITGYGQNGRYAKKASHDLNYVGLSGVLSLTGTAESGPVQLGFQLADVGAGGYMAAFGIVAALLKQHRYSECGYFLDISLTHGLLGWLVIPLGTYRALGEELPRGNWLLAGKYPCYRIYRCKDDRYITVAAIEQKFWHQLCEVLSVPELKPLQYAEGEQLSYAISRMEDIFSSKTQSEWIEMLREYDDICCEPVLEVRDLDQFELFSPLISKVKFPLMGFLCDNALQAKAPNHGEHTEKILQTLGYDSDFVAELKLKGVV